MWDERRASVLKAMLTSAVQRRFPPGLRVHVFSGSTVCLQDLVNAMKRHKLTITRWAAAPGETGCAAHGVWDGKGVGRSEQGHRQLEWKKTAMARRHEDSLRLPCLQFARNVFGCQLAARRRHLPTGFVCHPVVLSVHASSRLCVSVCVCSCRCKVRAYDNTSHTFSLLNQDGSLPSRQYVQMACQVGLTARLPGPLELPVRWCD